MNLTRLNVKLLYAKIHIKTRYHTQVSLFSQTQSKEIREEFCKQKKYEQNL